MAINSVQSQFVQLDQMSILGLTLPVVVCYIDKFNNKQFLVTLCQNSDKLGLLINDLNGICALLKGTKPEKFAPKKPCAALYATDDVWYRAEMVAHDPETKTMVVNFVDFGNTEMVSEKDVLPLPANFLTLPVQTLRCQFNNWPTFGAELAEKSTISAPAPKNFRLYDILYEKLTLKFLSIDEHCVFLVDSVGPISKYNDIPASTDTIESVQSKNGPLAANSFHTNGYMVGNGHVTDRNCQKFDKLCHIFGKNGRYFDKNCQNFDENCQNFDQSCKNSVENCQISASKDQKLNGILRKSASFHTTSNKEPEIYSPLNPPNLLANSCLPNKHVKKRRSPSTPRISGCGCKTSVQIDGLKNLVIPTCKNGYLDVCLSHLESTEKFFVHLLQHSEKVERLTTKLTRYCAELYKQKTLNRLKPADCRTGLICAAYHHHHTDTGKVAFYRCKIIDCSELTDSYEAQITAFFVDYGYTEQLPVRYIFELNDLYKRLPPYAIECSLKDVPSNKRANAKFAENVSNYTNLCVRLEGINSTGTGFLVTLFDDNCSNLSIYIALSKLYEPLKVRVAHPI